MILRPRQNRCLFSADRPAADIATHLIVHLATPLTPQIIPHATYTGPVLKYLLLLPSVNHTSGQRLVMRLFSYCYPSGPSRHRFGVAPYSALHPVSYGNVVAVKSHCVAVRIPGVVTLPQTGAQARMSPPLATLPRPTQLSALCRAGVRFASGFPTLKT